MCVCVCVCVCVSHSVVSDSLWPHEPQPARLLCPWNSPGMNTGVDYHFLLQRIFLTQGLNSGLLHSRQILYHLSYREVLTQSLGHLLSILKALVRLPSDSGNWDELTDKSLPTGLPTALIRSMGSPCNAGAHEMPKLGSKIGRVPNLILSLHDTLDCRQIQGCFCPHISKDSPVNTAPLAFTHRLFFLYRA